MHVHEEKLEFYIKKIIKKAKKRERKNYVKMWVNFICAFNENQFSCLVPIWKLGEIAEFIFFSFCSTKKTIIRIWDKKKGEFYFSIAHSSCLLASFQVILTRQFISFFIDPLMFYVKGTWRSSLFFFGDNHNCNNNQKKETTCWWKSRKKEWKRN